jgi:hypothetical protein
MNKAEEPTQNIEKETTMNRQPLQNQTPSHPAASPRSDRFRCGGREGNCIAAKKMEQNETDGRLTNNRRDVRADKSNRR